MLDTSVYSVFAGVYADDEIRQLDCHATNVARNDKRRLPGAPPSQ